MIATLKKMFKARFRRVKNNKYSRLKGNGYHLSGINNYVILFYIILISAFIVRTVNLNYNSAFNDEAIYIVIGRMGLFASDWWSYGARLWMAGLPYIYPTLSALAYQTGGLVGSRFLNVIFGVILVEEVYRFTNLLNLFDKRTNTVASLIAVFLAAFSGIGIFVSKLATYDMASFLLLIVGINCFLKAKYFLNGKYYFLAFLCLFAAFLTKIIIAVFFPILLVISFFITRTRSTQHKKLAFTYLYALSFLGVALYFYFYRDNLITYILTHNNLGKAEDYLSIPSLIWREAKIPLILLLPAAFMLVKANKTKALVALIALSAIIPVFHLALFRYATLDKHMYLTIIFLSIIAGYGSSLIILSKNKLVAITAKGLLPLVAFLYLVNSYQVLYDHEHDWKNTASLQSYLRQNVKPGDKVLTEEGGAVIFALYDKVFPPVNIVTFDWIDYSGLKDNRGYLQAITDVYFDYIELDEEFVGNDSLKSEIRQNLSANYSLINKQDSFEIYEKNEK